MSKYLLRFFFTLCVLNIIKPFAIKMPKKISNKQFIEINEPYRKNMEFSRSGMEIIFTFLLIDSKLYEWEYLQLTDSVTVVSSRWPSGMARFQMEHLYLAPSSSFRGSIVNVLVVCWSFEPPLLVGAGRGVVLPSRYHLKKIMVY